MNTRLSSLLIKPDRLFLIAAIVFGVLFAVFIPYGAGFDEEQHVIRIHDIARGNWLPNQPDPQTGTFLTPHDFFKYSYQRRFFQTPALDLLLGRGMRRPLNTTDFSETLTRSIYSPLNFLPQAAVAYFLWHKINLPVVPVVILARIAGLAVYIGLTFAAIRLLPVGRWLMVVLGLAPSALFQAATLNADGFTNAVSFLFVAVTLNLALDDQPLISRGKIALLIASLLLLGAAKPGMFVLFPLLLMLPVRRFPGWVWQAAVGAAVIVAIVFSVKYNALAVQSSPFMDSDEGNLTQQIQRIFEQPADFLYTFLWGNLQAAGNYFTEWIAVYGHWVGVVPAPVYVLFTAALFLALFFESEPVHLNRRQRWILIGVFLFSSATFAFLYTVNNYVPGSLAGFGHQGRYYIPTAPLLWLGVSGMVSLPRLAGRKSLLFLLLSGGLSLMLYTFGLFATYYTYCGTAIYTLQGCLQPVYKNIAWNETPPLSLDSSTRLRQEFPNRCGPIEQIQLYIRSHTGNADTSLLFALKDSTNRVLYEESIPAQSLPEMGFLNIDLPDEAKGKGSVIEIEISGGEIELALNGGDYFQEARLFANGEETEDDLVFRYVCQPFWKQIIRGVAGQGAGN